MRLSRQMLTTQCLESLAKHCPDLKECEVLGNFDITSLALNRPCLFLGLHYFAMRLQPDKIWSTENLFQLKAVLEHHIPRLTSLAGGYGKWWPYKMVSVQSPWTTEKLRRFVSRADEEDDCESDWSIITDKN